MALSRKFQPVSNLEIIRRMCEMLDIAQHIIRVQAELLAQHGIETGDGEMEAARDRLLKEIEENC